MAKVYISCHHPDPANELAAALKAAGHEVVSTWHTSAEPRPAADDAGAWGVKAWANRQLIREADALVVVACPKHLSGEERVPGGKFVEAGYAIAVASELRRMGVYTLGGVENGMLHDPLVKHARDTAELVSLLS